MLELTTSDEGHVNPTICFKLGGLEAADEEGPTAHGPRLHSVPTFEPKLGMDFYAFVKAMDCLKTIMPAKANALRMNPHLRLLNALVSDEEDSRVELWPEEKLVAGDLKEAITFGPSYASHHHAMFVLNESDPNEPQVTLSNSSPDWVLARDARIRMAKLDLPGLLHEFISGKQAVRNFRVAVFEAEQAMYYNQEDSESAHKVLADTKADLARAEEDLWQLHSKSFMRLFRCLVTVVDAWIITNRYSLTSTDPADPGCLAMRGLPFMASDDNELSEIIATGMCDDPDLLNEREDELEKSADQQFSEQEKERVIAGPTEQRPVRPVSEAIQQIEDEGYHLNQGPVDVSSTTDFPPLASNNPFLDPVDADHSDDEEEDSEAEDQYDDYRKLYRTSSMAIALLDDTQSEIGRSPIDQCSYRRSQNPFHRQSFSEADAETDCARIGANESEYSASPYGLDRGRFVVVSGGEPLNQSVLNVAAEGSVSEFDNDKTDTASVLSSTSSLTPTPTVVAQTSEQEPEPAESVEGSATIFEEPAELAPTSAQLTIELPQESGSGSVEEVEVVVAEHVDDQEQPEVDDQEDREVFDFVDDFKFQGKKPC